MFQLLEDSAQEILGSLSLPSGGFSQRHQSSDVTFT